jgi:drug/metabolite transporter (DMT)-like permease
VTDNLRGIIAVLIGSTAFVLNDAVIKLLTAELPSGEILIVRGAIATAMMGLGVVVMGATRPLSVLFQPMMLVRLITAAAATTFIVIALRYLPLPTLTVVLQVTPLAVTAGAAIVYGEKVPPWSAFSAWPLSSSRGAASARRPIWPCSASSSPPRATSPRADLPATSPRYWSRPPAPST